MTALKNNNRPKIISQEKLADIHRGLGNILGNTIALEKAINLFPGQRRKLEEISKEIFRIGKLLD